MNQVIPPARRPGLPNGDRCEGRGRGAGLSLLTDAPSPGRLVFVDLETSGLDPDRDLLLEVGLLITGRDLLPIASRSVVIHRTGVFLEAMAPWCVETHGRTGLTQACLESTLSTRAAESILVDFLSEHDLDRRPMDDRPPMVGQSVHFDYEFLRRQMPILHGCFYYGVRDISALGWWLRQWVPGMPEWRDEEAHRVDPDNDEARREAIAYRDALCLHMAIGGGPGAG